MGGGSQDSHRVGRGQNRKYGERFVAIGFVCSFVPLVLFRLSLPRTKSENKKILFQFPHRLIPHQVGHAFTRCAEALDALMYAAPSSMSMCRWVTSRRMTCAATCLAHTGTHTVSHEHDHASSGPLRLREPDRAELALSQSRSPAWFSNGLAVVRCAQ